MNENPLGLNGVSFLEYTCPQPEFFGKLFTAWGFEKVGSIPNKKLHLYRQNNINFIVNSESQTFAETFFKAHGPSICSTGFRFHNAEEAFQKAIERGARPCLSLPEEKGATPFRAIYGIGDSLVYFLDLELEKKLYGDFFKAPSTQVKPFGFGFTIVDHFTNNVPKGEMQKWCDFYERIFGFRETKSFDIRGQQTGLISKVMRSPCDQFAVPINEPSIGKSQIQEYLDEYHGSGIQHVALLTNDIVPVVEKIRNNGIEFLTPPPGTYYKMLKDRLPKLTENTKVLEERAILADGDEEGYLLQIFTKNLIGPIFFEVIQRKGHSGFGEGNFQALFDAIERDQQERGYL